VLYEYVQDLQRLLRDQTQQTFNQEDLIRYVNLARKQIAKETQCIRVLPPTSAGISTITVTAGGTLYSATPTVTVSAPDSPDGAVTYPTGSQATATAVVVGGIITDIQVTFGGSGYFQPTVTITDSTGTGATATAAVNNINITATGQEIYNFSAVDLSSFSGVDSFHMVRSVSIIFNNLRYSLARYSFSMYQARFRTYPKQYLYVPALFSQFGQGNSGSLYLYPIPSQAYQMEWDCSCLPSNLVSENSPEAIPDPWRDSVKYMAGYFMYLELQNLNYAEYYKKQYRDWLLMDSQAARPGHSINIGGRY